MTSHLNYLNQSSVALGTRRGSGILNLQLRKIQQIIDLYKNPLPISQWCQSSVFILLLIALCEAACTQGKRQFVFQNSVFFFLLRIFVGCPFFPSSSIVLNTIKAQRYCRVQSLLASHSG